MKQQFKRLNAQALIRCGSSRPNCTTFISGRCGKWRQVRLDLLMMFWSNSYLMRDIGSRSHRSALQAAISRDEDGKLAQLLLDHGADLDFGGDK